MVDKYLKSNWLLFIIALFIISRIIMYYQFNVANVLLLKGNGSFLTTMCKWDCKWYLTIINNGYDDAVRTTPKIWKGLANWAFFPLYPTIVALVSKSLHVGPILTGVVLNQLFILVAAIFFYKLLRLNFDDINSRFGVALLIFSPFSIYFSSLYTEGLYILLSIMGFYFLRTNRIIVGAIFGGLLSATRPVGIMFTAPIIVNYLRSRTTLFKAIVAIIIASSGLIAFMFFLHNKTGDFLAFQHIQKGWGRKGWNDANLGRQLWNMITDFHNSMLFALSFVMSIYLIFKKYYEEAVFNLACILPGVLTGTMMSEGRFCGTLFTLYFAMVVLAEKSWTSKILILATCVVLYMSYYIYWVGHSNFLI